MNHGKLERKEARGTRPVAMGWHGVVFGTPGQQDASFFATPDTFVAIVYCCSIFLDKERSPNILIGLNLGLCEILETSIFSCTQIIYSIVLT